MKFKVTKKEMKESNAVVIAVGYCQLQNALSSINAIAYNSGANGWCCDLYKINERYSIVTGYSCDRANTVRADFNLVRECEVKANEIKSEMNASKNFNADELQKLLHENLIKFCDAVYENQVKVK